MKPEFQPTNALYREMFRGCCCAAIAMFAKGEFQAKVWVYDTSTTIIRGCQQGEVDSCSEELIELIARIHCRKGLDQTCDLPH